MLMSLPWAFIRGIPSEVQGRGRRVVLPSSDVRTYSWRIPTMRKLEDFYVDPCLVGEIPRCAFWESTCRTLQPCKCPAISLITQEQATNA